MKVLRDIIFYKHHFGTFFESLSEKAKSKIDEVLFLITSVERVPVKFLKNIEGIKGLYEIRVEYESNIYRIFCCFDKGNVIILFNGFQKKAPKTLKKELKKAEKLMGEYFTTKKLIDEK